MDYRIIEKPALHVAGKALRTSTKDGENQKTIPAFWQQSIQDGSIRQVSQLAAPHGEFGGALLGICTDFQHDMPEFSYLIAVETQPSAVADGLVEKDIPASTYAVFEAVGSLPNAIQQVWGHIFAEFFPSMEYGHAPDGSDIEVYPAGDVTSDSYRCEVWIPVIKKS